VSFETLGCGEVYNFGGENVLSKHSTAVPVVEHESAIHKTTSSKCTSSPL